MHPRHDQDTRALRRGSASRLQAKHGAFGTVATSHASSRGAFLANGATGLAVLACLSQDNAKSNQQQEQPNRRLHHRAQAMAPSGGGGLQQGGAARNCSARTMLAVF